jgi:flagellar assembly factor FliW
MNRNDVSDGFVTATEAVELTFASGLPGFPNDRRFVLEPWGAPDSPFGTLVSTEHTDTGFVVAAPWAFYPDYEFDLPAETVERLGIADPRDAMVLCVVTVGEQAESSTINLLGPIVVDRRTHEACQAVLDGAHDVRAPLRSLTPR